MVNLRDVMLEMAHRGQNRGMQAGIREGLESCKKYDAQPEHCKDDNEWACSKVRTWVKGHLSRSLRLVR